jgi:GTP-binding protein HflX
MTGEGVEDLLLAIQEHLAAHHEVVEVSIDLSDGAAIGWLYDHGQVLEREDDERHAHLRVRLPPTMLERYHRRQGASSDHPL